MRVFEITPHEGVGPIKLGMSRADVVACFGTPEHLSASRVWYHSGFAIDFDENQQVEFIELATSGEFKAIYKNLNLHEIPADQAVEAILQDDVYDKNDPELGHSYIFKSLQLSLWRETIAESEFDEDGKYFQAVGVAADGYFE